MAVNIAPYATLINQKVLMPSHTQYVAVQRDHLIDFLKPTLRQVFFDVEWYLRTYPDIAEAIEGGIIVSAQEHYVTSGYYEHRFPYEIEVDEAWYMKQYNDVWEAISNKKFVSARDHYYAVGYREGRLPFARFALRMVEYTPLSAEPEDSRGR